ncbi:MAG: TlpA disulfide reductase family protein [Gammaproteobacteria bacterium]|jgi:thiol-disulfide isomerase/thioredoxin
MVRFFVVLLLSSALSVSVHAAETVDFTLPDLDGKSRQLSEFRGKWVVVNYWATWCPPCLEEIPELVDFHEAHKDNNAVVIGVDFEDIAIPKLKSFVEDYFMSYPILHMKPAPKSELGVISGLPTSFLISPEGELVAKQTGPVTAKMIKDFIDGYNSGER